MEPPQVSFSSWATLATGTASMGRPPVGQAGTATGRRPSGTPLPRLPLPATSTLPTAHTLAWATEWLERERDSAPAAWLEKRAFVLRWLGIFIVTPAAFFLPLDPGGRL